MMIGDVLHQIYPIRTFLAENKPEGETMSFLECRREWYVQKRRCSMKTASHPMADPSVESELRQLL
ncbi:MAG: hypothetical protein R3D70_09450 [Rhizobiaceae bacterium]